jgi:hypothetical protein
MGFWRGVAYALDRKMAEEADRRQQEYNQNYGYRGPSIIRSFLANRRADAYADQYWEDNRRITNVDLGHPPGCTCIWHSR